MAPSLVLAVAVAGVALVMGSGSGSTEETTLVVVFRTNPQPDFVTEAIPEGPIQTDSVVAVQKKTVSTIQANPSQSGTNMTRARLRVELVIQTTPDGLPQFNGERLYVGREMTLDFRTTIVDGTVIDIEQ